MAKIEDLSGEIAKALRDYTNEVEHGLEVSKVEIAKDTVNRLKKTSPRLTGEYAKGWSHKKIGSARVVYNRTKYQLTHLLEHGHANRGGGRTPGQPHIGPAEQQAVDDFTKRVERMIKG